MDQKKDESLIDKEQNPSKYLVQHDSWPPYYVGSLLSWLSLSLRCKDKIYQCSDIAYIVCTDDETLLNYSFEIEAFDVEFNSRGGPIRGIESCIERFVMKDGSMFIVFESDGERTPTSLRYYESLDKNVVYISGGLGALMHRK